MAVTGESKWHRFFLILKIRKKILVCSNQKKNRGYVLLKLCFLDKEIKNINAIGTLKSISTK